MKTFILSLFIATFAIAACNGQIENDTKHKVIIFKDDIFDLDNLNILANIDGEIDTAKLDIVWNINNEKAENNVIKPHSKVTIKDKEEREFEIKITEILAKEANQNYAVVLKNKEKGETAWTYSDFSSCYFGHTIQMIVAGNKIIIATHSPIATGSDLVCLDIYSGKEIWRGDIKQLNVGHSKYSNSVYLKSFDDKIVIAGDESGGDYIQVIDINTGANLFTKMSNDRNNHSEKNSILIDEEKALEIANNDAQKAYRDLSIYNIKAELKDEEWHIDYNLSNPQMLGGGPHYVISAKTGKILSYKYEQ